jgi:hypothetical protein
MLVFLIIYINIGIFFIITLGKNIVAFNKIQFVNCIEHHTKLSTGDITKSTTFEPNFFFSILCKKMKFMIHAYKYKILCTSAKFFVQVQN